MRLAVRRPSQVLALVEELREHHPALRGRFTWRVAQRVFAEAAIGVEFHRMRSRARTVSLGGITVITINPDQPARWHAGLAAHEWGHVLLHTEPGAVRQLAPCYQGDPRELEAKLFARILILGARDLDHPDLAPLAGRLERAAAQLTLPLEEVPRAPRRAPDRTPWERERPIWDTPLQYAFRVRRSFPMFRRVVEPPDPWGELRYDVDRHGLYWTDRAGNSWRIHTRPDRRVFVSPSGRHFVYRFRRGERRQCRPSHLDLQLREAQERRQREIRCTA